MKKTKKLSRILSLAILFYLLKLHALNAQVANGPTCSSYVNNALVPLGLGPIRCVYVSGDTIYAGTDYGLQISTDGGNNFTNSDQSNGLGTTSCDVYGVYASGGKVYAALNGEGLGISTNGGNFFTMRNSLNGLNNLFCRGVYVNADTVYVSNYFGLYISTNGGNSFVRRITANGLGSSIVNKAYATGGKLYAATNGGLSISVNGGISFSNRTPANGLGSVTVLSVFVIGNNVYAATQNGLSISTDGGNIFSNKTTLDGLGNNIVNDVYAIGNTVYAATSGGLSISTDGGNTFTNYSSVNGLGGNAVLGSYVSGNKIYAATDGGLSTCSGTPICTPTSSTETISACGSYTWHGTTYTSSNNTATWLTTNAGGCDSTVTLNLTINTPPTQPTGLACYQTATFNNTSCSWDISGTQPSQPSLACYQTATFNNTSCSWDVTGSQPMQPVGLACYKTTSFNTSTCQWDTTGTQPQSPALVNINVSFTGYCGQVSGTYVNSGLLNGYYDFQFNYGITYHISYNGTNWVFWVNDINDTNNVGFVSSGASNGLYPPTTGWSSVQCGSGDLTWSYASPLLSCYQTANWDSVNCQWIITGTQPTLPNLACYETATFNNTSCSWDVSGLQPTQPTVACYETASFNTTTCQWDVSGTQPSAPTGLSCYETANFNSSTCSWVITGTQPSQPTLACYETASFNTATCQWDVTGTAAAAIVTNASGCDSYTWAANGQVYTQSGTYSYYSNCQDYTLNLTIITSTAYYSDVDGDGYGNTSSTTLSCNGAPTGYVAIAGDCNDNNANMHPGATEICGNGIDDNCDGAIDEGTSVTANPITGNLKICNLYAGATTLTTTPVNGVSTYNWTVPSDMTITSGQGTTTITVYWGNIYLLANGILGDVTVTAMGTTTGCGTLIPAKLPVDLQYTAPVTPPSISGASAICPSESSVYSVALVKRASSYEWTVPSGATITSGSNTNIINVSYANGFTGGNITVGARNVCGLSTPVRSRTVTLNVLPAPTAITGPVDGLCNASNANYLVNAVSGASSYNWTAPTNSSINSGANGNNISVNFNGSFTTGNITVAAVNNCGVGATRSLALKAAPATPGTITGPATACAGSNQSYSISTVQGASNYTWTIPGGAIINSGQGSKNLSLNYGSVASSNGIITVKSSNTCGTSTAKVLSVVTTVCPRIGDITTQLQVYPNPASSFINVSFILDQSQSANISLRDAAGRVVYCKSIDATAGINNQEVELSNLASGVYFVQLQTATATENSRLIIE